MRGGCVKMCIRDRCEAAPVATRCEEKGSAVDGRLLVSMLAKDAAGMISYYECPVDFTLDLSLIHIFPVTATQLSVIMQWRLTPTCTRTSICLSLIHI